MESVDNNQFEVKPSAKSKRKITTPSTNVYLNPALDLLANEDPMCNTAMEIMPKKRKRTKSCDIATFENTALDLGISKAAVNEFLARELNNVKKNMKPFDFVPENNSKTDMIDETVTEPIYANLTEINMSETRPCQEIPNLSTTLDLSEIKTCDETVDIDSGISEIEQKSLNTANVNTISEISSISNITNIQTNITNQLFINNPSNLSLSFIDRLALDSPNASNQSLYFDDDLNESNIMEIKTITIITKKKKVEKNTNPFLNPDINDVVVSTENPFLDTKPEMEYNDEIINRPENINKDEHVNMLMPRRLFAGDTNSTISTVNESVSNQNEYENIDSYRSESPIYENCDDQIYNKQSKILGFDVSQFSAVDIMNLNKNQANSSNESNDSKKDFKSQILKATKLPKKVFKTLKRTFRHEKHDPNLTLNPYEVPRKPPKTKPVVKEAGFENPALNLDISDDIEIEEIDGVEHEYETIKTLRNTRLNMNVTPLKERNEDEVSHNRTYTPGKKVRFDSTLNQEKVITGNSFDYDIQSPGFDAKIDKYHDELENCINERKFLQQNM